MTRDDLAKLVLNEVAWQCLEIRTRPRPPAWKTWEVRDDDADRSHGPRYTPTWFGDLAATEARRVRLRRTLYRLADAGLLIVTKGEGGRLERVRLTVAGWDAVVELTKADTNLGANVNLEYVENVFDAPLAVIHESAHAVAALIVGLPVASCTVNADGNGLTVVGHDGTNSASLARLAVVYAAAIALHERCGVDYVGCLDDFDNVTVTMAAVRRMNGRDPDTWGEARRLIRSRRCSVKRWNASCPSWPRAAG